MAGKRGRPQAHGRVIALADGPVVSAADVSAQSAPPLSNSGDIGDGRRREQLRGVLASVDWDTGKAEAVLGMDRTTVCRRMNRLGITPARSARG